MAVKLFGCYLGLDDESKSLRRKLDLCTGNIKHRYSLTTGVTGAPYSFENAFTSPPAYNISPWRKKYVFAAPIYFNQ